MLIVILFTTKSLNEKNIVNFVHESYYPNFFMKNFDDIKCKYELK